MMKKCYSLAVTRLSVLLKGVTFKKKGNFYCLNWHQLLESNEEVYRNHYLMKLKDIKTVKN